MDLAPREARRGKGNAAARTEASAHVMAEQHGGSVSGAIRGGRSNRVGRTYCVPVTLAIRGTETSDMCSLSSM